MYACENVKAISVCMSVNNEKKEPREVLHKETRRMHKVFFYQKEEKSKSNTRHTHPRIDQRGTGEKNPGLVEQVSEHPCE